LVIRFLLALGLCGIVCTGADLVEKARQAQGRGDYRAAAEAWRAIVESEPGNAEARSNFGVMLHLAGEEKQALEQFRRALREKPGLIAANLFAGVALVNLGHPREAIGYLESARFKDGSGVAPSLALARAYVALREFDKATGYYREASERDASNAEAWFGLGITCRNLADSELRKHGGVETTEATRLLARALEALTHAVALDPQSERVHLIRGESLRDAGHLQDAIQEYQMAIRLHPGSAAAYLGLATTYWKTGEMGNVSAPLLRALELSPRDPEGNGIMADLLVRQGDLVGATRCAKVALEGNPGLFHVRAVLAKVYLAQKRADLAVLELEKAAPFDITGSYYFLLYRALKQLGREQDAGAALEKYKQIHGSSAQP
jgi:tetratricopeptide (TPR) repeat protein